ncbi:MAG TPA: hydrolase [Candidatus Omnitrophica bacterium]|nr:hydrolase [Candidatus Omnitrophota bacterium]
MRDEAVHLRVEGVTLEGDLVLPANAKSIVVFAHGSGSSRFSPRNRFVAGVLNKAGIATLLMDLLTASEDEEDEVTAKYRFDISLLGRRVIGAIDRLISDERTARLFYGVFGASTGAAAALVAAAERPKAVKAVVSRGGRPDLADAALHLVEAPTLFIVGQRDELVIDLNKKAFDRLKCKKELSIIPRASHLFEEPGTLEEAARQAADWFKRYLI